MERGSLADRDYPAELSLVFKGTASEYFRIWIINTCLTLLTFGIFSAWAKVRKKRYLYAHTELEGVPFRYLAEPIPILKGRLVGALLLALWYAGTHFSQVLLLVALALGAVLSPWVLVRSAAFNARYSSYRNFHFRFTGTYGRAAALLLTTGLLVVLTCGLGYPWAVARVRRFMLENSSFGGQPGTFSGQGGHLLFPYFAVAVAGALLGGALAGLNHVDATWGKHAVGFATALTYLGYGLGYAYLRARVDNILWRHTGLGPFAFDATFRARDLAWLYLSNAVLSVASLGLLIERRKVLEQAQARVFGDRCAACRRLHLPIAAAPARFERRLLRRAHQVAGTAGLVSAIRYLSKREGRPDVSQVHLVAKRGHQARAQLEGAPQVALRSLEGSAHLLEVRRVRVLAKLGSAGGVASGG